jgi:Tfp pilus assembly PilM family ATPase
MALLSDKSLCIDIRENVIRFVDGYREGSNIFVDRFGTIVLDEKFVEDGVINKTEETLKIIKNLGPKNDIQTRIVKLNLWHKSLVFRVVKVPFMPKEDLELFLHSEINRILQMGTDELVYDYRILEKIEDDDKSFLNILISSFPKQLKLGIMELFQKANLKVVAMDVYPNTISRLFGGNYTQDIAVAGVNGNNLDFMILSKGNVFMYSNTLLDDFGGFGVEGNEQKIGLLRDEVVLHEVMKPIHSFISSYLSYFSSRKEGKSVDKMYLLGSISELENIDKHLENRFNIPVTIGFPHNFKLHSSHNLTYYMGALGLLLRNEE